MRSCDNNRKARFSQNDLHFKIINSERKKGCQQRPPKVLKKLNLNISSFKNSELKHDNNQIKNSYIFEKYPINKQEVFKEEKRNSQEENKSIEVIERIKIFETNSSINTQSQNESINIPSVGKSNNDSNSLFNKNNYLAINEIIEISAKNSNSNSYCSRLSDVDMSESKNMSYLSNLSVDSGEYKVLKSTKKQQRV